MGAHRVRLLPTELPDARWNERPEAAPESAGGAAGRGVRADEPAPYRLGEVTLPTCRRGSPCVISAGLRLLRLLRLLRRLNDPKRLLKLQEELLDSEFEQVSQRLTGLERSLYQHADEVVRHDDGSFPGSSGD